MVAEPSLIEKFSKKVQTRINNYIPDKIHKAITVAIKQMIRGVLFGAGYITKKPAEQFSLQETETLVQNMINRYKHSAAAEGGLTGAGGILLAFADFPILLSIKLKLLFDIASLYGYDVDDYKERIYILYIFQLAFSSPQHRKKIFGDMEGWNNKKEHLPENINDFNWRALQQEYRDYIDLAKMAQLIPGIGAIVGYVVNYKLILKLGNTAMFAYRMRWAENENKTTIPALLNN